MLTSSRTTFRPCANNAWMCCIWRSSSSSPSIASRCRMFEQPLGCSIGQESSSAEAAWMMSWHCHSICLSKDLRAAEQGVQSDAQGRPRALPTRSAELIQSRGLLQDLAREFGKQQEVLADASNRLHKEERIHKEDALHFQVSVNLLAAGHGLYESRDQRCIPGLTSVTAVLIAAAPRSQEHCGARQHTVASTFLLENAASRALAVLERWQ